MKLEAILKVICIFFILICLVGCGVKGDPLPPEQPPRLGRGYPTYSKASEAVSPDYSSQEEEKKDKKNER